MPLIRDPASTPWEDPRVGVGLSMLNGTEKVTVWVNKAALLMLRDKAPGANDLKAVERSLEAIEALASANYDVGIIEPDGSTIIRREDVEWLS